MTPPDDQRRAELVSTLGAVRARISQACATAGRDPHAVHVIAVTKTFPASDAAALAGIGVLDFGESRDQEAVAKVAETARLLTRAGTANGLGIGTGIGTGIAAVSAAPRWHFVGRLQSRKCRSVVGYASVVHSVDRPELVPKLAAAVDAAERAPLEVFVQVSLDGDPDRGGVPAAHLEALADAVAATTQLRLLGVMAVAPAGADPDAAFATLAEVALRLRQHHPDAKSISAGMSGDFESAVGNGATHVRVGSALLGRRTP
jgi:uncharacterized pyridoxal phosphate-containing UPF0001 family protein